MILINESVGDNHSVSHPDDESIVSHSGDESNATDGRLRSQAV